MTYVYMYIDTLAVLHVSVGLAQARLNNEWNQYT